MKIREEKIDLKRHVDDNCDNMYEMLSMLPKVKSSIKHNITSDYTLAILNKDEKEFITENYSNAEFAKEIIERFGFKGYKYEWNVKNKDWERNEDGSYKKFPLMKEEIELIMKMAERVFTFFMIQPHMMAILNRNSQDNFLVKLLGKSTEEEKPVTFEKEDKSIIQKIGEFFKGKQEEEGDEND